MSWMNASAAAAADRRNAALSKWDHSVESPDGYGRRDAGPEIDPTAPAATRSEESPWPSDEEMKAACEAEEAAEAKMLADMLAEGGY